MQALLLFFVVALTTCADTMAEVDNESLRAVAETTSPFANEFLKTAASATPGNLISSPLSAQTVLAMAAYGAGGNTALQMRSTLRLPADNNVGQSGYQSLIQTLNSAKGIELRMANKVYTGTGFIVKPAYKQITATKFLSSSEEVDFTNAAVAAQTINTWCEQQTNNRIKDVITPDSITPDTKMVLVNAVYFKGLWAKKFDVAQTRDKPFHVDARTVKNVPTMFIKQSFRVAHLPEVNARLIEIPYQGGDVSMVIILPNEIDGLRTVQENLSQINVSQCLRNSYPRDVELHLPKFKIETTLDLKETLQKMGMTDMFKDQADFSGIADIPLKVSKVVQKAFIEVNEEGSEAAAVTGIQFIAESLVQALEIKVDRPFLYMIMHQELDTPIFSGQTLSPAIM